MSTAGYLYRRMALGILLLGLAGVLPAASPPGLINCRGALRGATDEPLAGTYGRTFRFFDAGGGGDEILLDGHLAASSQAVAVSEIREVLANAGSAPISPGDFPATSATQGAARRATAAEPGTILGKVLEPPESGIGTIRVLLMPR